MTRKKEKYIDTLQTEKNRTYIVRKFEHGGEIKFPLDTLEKIVKKYSEKTTEGGEK